MKTITIRYKSTSYYLLDTGNGLFAFDAGWPDTYREFRDALKERGYRIKDIRWLIVSHFHMDHAGLAGMFADNGIGFFVFRNQTSAIEEMESLIEQKKIPYHKIDMNKVVVKEISESRTWLQSLGIQGEVIQTTGHADHCVSLLLDTGEAFIGDLPPEGMIEDDDSRSKNDWQMLRLKGAKFIKPAHADAYVI